MDKSEGNKFKELIAAISVTYGGDFTPAQTLLWWNMFKPYSAEVFERAVYQHMADPDQGMFSPKPANIMKFISGTTKQNDQAVKDKAELAWHQVMDKIQRVGSYGSLSLDDKQAIAAVKAIGGWNKVSLATYDQITWMKKEFMLAYDTYENTPLDRLPSSLPGLVELQHHKCQDRKALGGIIQEMEERNNAKALPDNSSDEG